MRNKQIIIAGGIVVIVLLIVVFIVVISGDSGPGDDPGYVHSQDDPTEFVPGESGEDGGGPGSIPPNDPIDRLNAYREWAQYPPFSRPLHPGQADLIQPYDIGSAPVNVVAQPARGCSTNSDGQRECDEPAQFADFACTMRPEREISVGKGDFRVFVECLDNQGQRQKIDSLEAKTYIRLNRREIPSLPPIHIGDDGSEGDAAANDMIYTVTVRPTDKDWGLYYVDMTAQVNGNEHSQRADFWSTPHTVATFADSGIRDTTEDGHLIVEVPVNILKAGDYEFDANLQEEGGDQRFLATSTVREDFSAGPQIVRFQFWGKILRDQGVDGPYVVREIRGKRSNSVISRSQIRESRETGEPLTGEQTEPLWEFMEPFGENYVTRSYEANDFSSAEWDSPEKQDRLRLLESQVN